MAGRTGDYIPEKQAWSNVVYMPCTAETNFAPELPKETPDIIYLCFPNNPTGSTITKDELQKWVDYANKVGAVIIYDAAYEAYISEPDVPHTIYECEGALSRSIMIASRSPVYWWVSKYIIAVLAALVYMVLIIVTFAVSGFAVLGNKFSLRMHFTARENIKLILGSEDISCNTNVVLLMVLCTLSLITACIIILLVSYVFNSIFGFIINLLLFIFSICYMSGLASIII